MAKTCPDLGKVLNILEKINGGSCIVMHVRGPLAYRLGMRIRLNVSQATERMRNKVLREPDYMESYTAFLKSRGNIREVDAKYLNILN